MTFVQGHFRAFSQGQKHDRTISALRVFDRVFRAWQQIRKFGRHGKLDGLHNLRVDLYNELVEAGLTSFPTTREDPLLCYNPDCDLSCENHATLRGRLSRVLERYSAPTTWEQSLTTRLQRGNEVIYILELLINSIF